MTKFVKFAQILDFQPKSYIKAGEGLNKGKYPFFTSSAVLSKCRNTSQFSIPSLVFGTGGNASVHYCDFPFSVSTDCLVAQIKKKFLERYEIKFVYYYLYGNIWILERGFKGAGLKHTSKEYINNIDIPDLTLDAQKRVVKILDNVDVVRQCRRQAIELLDDYLKSIFLEKFGDKTSDNTKWDSVEFKKIAKDEKGSMRTGPFGSDLLHSEFVKSGVAVIGIDNAIKNKFSWDERRFITKEKYEKLKRYTLYPRDVIITIMGTVGRSAVIPDDIPLAINTKHLAAITVDTARANPYFISYSLYSNPEIIRQIQERGKGAIMTGLNLGIIKELIFKLPPVELQNKFEDLLQNTENLKQKMLQQSGELENQFQALMQKAFKGEL